MLKSSKIPVECCLTSNVLSKTVKSYDDHHFKELFNSNHPVVISVSLVYCRYTNFAIYFLSYQQTDDLGVFNTNLSNELLIAQETFNLTENDLIHLTENAINSSFASNFEKEAMLQKLNLYRTDI